MTWLDPLTHSAGTGCLYNMKHITKLQFSTAINTRKFGNNLFLQIRTQQFPQAIAVHLMTAKQIKPKRTEVNSFYTQFYVILVFINFNCHKRCMKTEESGNNEYTSVQQDAKIQYYGVHDSTCGISELLQ
jgi:hypothetical protein